jgi:transposase IS116/IS110/IS902 family protein
MIGRLPESWIPPAHILDLRARVRLRHALSYQRGGCQQRIEAVLYHHGCPRRGNLITSGGRSWLAAQRLPAGAREQITVALAVIDALEAQLALLDRELRAFARRQAGGKTLMGQFGVGGLTAVTILAELGDASRFSSSRDAVRFAGLDITVHQPDQRRAPGHLSRQGPPALRWALFEASMCAARACSPDYEYYSQAAERLGSDHPIDHHVAGPGQSRVVDRDKAERPRAHQSRESPHAPPPGSAGPPSQTTNPEGCVGIHAQIRSVASPPTEKCPPGVRFISISEWRDQDGW